jgi:hypothetical protein
MGQMEIIWEREKKYCFQIFNEDPETASSSSATFYKTLCEGSVYNMVKSKRYNAQI